VVWLEGDREGRGLHPRVRVPLRSGLREARAGGGHFLFAVGPESAPPRLAPPVIAAIDRPIPDLSEPQNDRAESVRPAPENDRASRHLTPEAFSLVRISP